MNPLRHFVAMAAVFASLAAFSTSPCAAGRTEGLADAERVLRDAAAPTEADAAQRRYAALLVLAGAARRVTTLQGARPQPDDTALVAGYNRAMQQLMREAAASGPPACAGEQCPAQQLMRRALELARSAGFAQGVLQKFSTPAWQQANMAALFPRPGAAAPEAGGAPAAGGQSAPTTPLAQAQPSSTGGPLPAGFEFLARMPSVERVLQEVAGADAVDTKVQQQAAFYILAMDVLLTMRSGAPQVPPQFAALDRAYKAEVTRLDREVRAETGPSSQPQVFRQLMAYQGSTAFKQQLFQRFFDAAFVAAYEQKKAEFERWRVQAQARPGGGGVAAGRSGEPGGSGAPGPGAAMGATGGAATAAAATAAPPAAPRVLRSPSGVDMMVFGLAIGEPLQLPRCTVPRPNVPRGASLADEVSAGLAAMQESRKSTCIQEGAMATWGFGQRGVFVRIGSDRCPPWIGILLDCTINALVLDGRLHGVMAKTGGQHTDEQVSRDLKEKYGKPTGVGKITVSNDVGGRWELEELTWELKDLLVVYTPFDGRRDVGSVGVFSPEGFRAVKDERKREDARRPRM